MAIVADLELYGPAAQHPVRLTPRKSRRYCRRLARKHYENFTVASWLLPGSARQHFCNLYAYCRWADDLADEIHSPQQSLALLQWWEMQLRRCYGGQAEHPVFVALGETIRCCQIPIDPFLDLLVAFRQDQRVRHYQSQEQLLDYCRYSANPVGRLVLCVAGCNDPQRARLADNICTGLQLANFCQDVARDLDQGRIYLPQLECHRYGYEESMLARRECNGAFRQLLAAQSLEAEGRLKAGRALVAHMPADYQLAVALFIEGGLAILDAIRRQDYDVWTKRPRLSRGRKLRLATSVWWSLKRGTYQGLRR